MNDMGDYYDLYIEREVLLLDVFFAKVIGTCLEYLN